MNRPTPRSFPLRTLAFAATALALPFFSPAAADDRDVLRAQAGKPYLFFLLDNSASMSRQPPCDAGDIADGKCEAADFCADDLGCRLPLDGDDPKSKFRIAREAMYEVLQSVTDIDFGFAVMDQDQLRVLNKHWLYTVSATQAGGFFSLAGGFTFPTAGAYTYFGGSIDEAHTNPVGCASGKDNENVGCFPVETGNCTGGAKECMPADTNDAWEYERFQKLPKLGANGGTTTVYYLRVPTGNTRYRVEYSASTPVTYAATGSIDVTVSVRQCSDDLCTTFAAAATTRTITYNAAGGEFLINDPLIISKTGDSRTKSWLGYADARTSEDCDWEAGFDAVATVNETPFNAHGGSNNIPNTDLGDAWTDASSNTYTLTWPDVESGDPLDWNQDGDDPAGAPDEGDRYISCFDEGSPATSAQDSFREGDMLPFDWNDSHLDEILNHLAAQRSPVADLNPDDDFTSTAYFADTRAGTDKFLRYKSESQRVLIPAGAANIGYAIRGFRQWFTGCEHGSCNSSDEVGWDDIASVCDPTWGCRQKFLVILTDGDEDDDTNCSPPSNPCSATASMRSQTGIQTYVIAFGRENSGHNVLNCLAANTHSQDPIYPRNKQDLVDILNEIIGRVREEASAFASAAVPQVQANATDKIYLSSFTPLNDSGYWAGRLDAFLKPLPLLPGGEPDRSTVCSSSIQSQCFLWDAGDVQEGHPGDSGYQPGRLLLQAPDDTEVDLTDPTDATVLQLGAGVDERRVVYSQFASTGNRRLFTYPPAAPDAIAYDMFDAFGLTYTVGDTTSEAQALADSQFAIAKTLVEKEATVTTTDPNDPNATITTPITFLMGDIFHADPIVLSRPNNFLYYTNDPYLNQALCNTAASPTRTPPPSYRWFADRHFCRRSLLMTAANDGQLHVFDGGTFGDVGSGAECLLPAKDLDADGNAEVDEFNLSGMGDPDYDIGDEVNGFKSCNDASDCGAGPCSGGFCTDVKVGVVDGAYSNGTGREIFSFIPRALMRRVYEMSQPLANRKDDDWGMDGSPRIDDVFIDPLATESSVTCLNREWRTVAIGGYREGGSGYYALDITQPDTLDNDHVPVPAGTPAYVPSCFGGGSGCSRPYPSVLWEFQDIENVSVGSGTVATQLDEDLNGVPDLANSWGRPTTGRIRVCTGGCAAADTEDRFVAVFGGGVGDDPGDAHGNYIYMVDIETGKTIYKKPVTGAVPADVAAVDANVDGYIDRLYVGTEAGFVYKVQLETNPAIPHKIANQTITTRIAGSDYTFTAARIEGPVGETAKYDPFQVFSTGGRAIYHEISAIFVAQQNRLAMAFGTGNRWNLWDNTGEDGRFYVILDENFVDANHDGVLDGDCGGTCAQPRTEASYTSIDPLDAPATGANYLFDGATGLQRGWFFELDPDEKVITEGFSLGGVTIFTSFVPTQFTDSDGNCTKAGTSRIFIVGTVTAIGYAVPPGGTISDRARYNEIFQFTTPPFVERSATANPDSGTGNTQHADYITDSLAVIRDELKKLQSNRCRYAGYTQNIKTIRSDTGVVFVAPIPLCMDPTSWKEF